MELKHCRMRCSHLEESSAKVDRVLPRAVTATWLETARTASTFLPFANNRVPG